MHDYFERGQIYEASCPTICDDIGGAIRQRHGTHVMTRTTVMTTHNTHCATAFSMQSCTQSAYRRYVSLKCAFADVRNVD